MLLPSKSTYLQPFADPLDARLFEHVKEGPEARLRLVRCLVQLLELPPQRNVLGHDREVIGTFALAPRRPRPASTTTAATAPPTDAAVIRPSGSAAATSDSATAYTATAAAAADISQQLGGRRAVNKLGE